MGHQRYTPEFKDEAVRQVLERGHPVSEVALSQRTAGHYDWGTMASNPGIDLLSVAPSADKIVILAYTISWSSPYEPEVNWVPVKTLPATATDQQIENAKGQVLSNRDYFRTCEDCNEIAAVGSCSEVNGRDVCHRCASENHGVVY